MEVRGNFRTVVNVEVDDREVIEAITNIFQKKVTPKDIPCGAYVNRDGVWELWEDGHGSGYTSKYRAATPEEATLYGTFRQWEITTSELRALKA